MFGTIALQYSPMASIDTVIKDRADGIDLSRDPACDEVERKTLEDNLLEGIKKRTKTEANRLRLDPSEAASPGPGYRPLRRTPRNYADIKKPFGPLHPNVVRAIVSFVEVPRAR